MRVRDLLLVQSPFLGNTYFEKNALEMPVGAGLSGSQAEQVVLIQTLKHAESPEASPTVVESCSETLGG